MKNLLIFFFFINFTSFGQIHTKVYGLELDSIQKWVKQKPAYFKYLQRKFLKTNLDEDELVLLYYGSAFLPDYNPKKASKEIEKMTELMGNMDFEAGLKTGEILLKKYPVEARLYMLLGYAAKKTGDEKKSEFYYKKYGDLLRVALYSGNGKDFDSAFVVRSTSDEYLIINQKNLELLSQEVRYHNQIPFDKMTLAPKNYPDKKQNVYFNIYLPLFVAQHKTYKDIQKEAIIKFKIDTTKLHQKYIPKK